MVTVVHGLLGRIARTGLFLFLCAVLVAPVTACCGHVQPVARFVDQRNAVEQDEDKSVAILPDKSGKPKCGGSWVSADQILTAGHCVAHAGEPAGWELFNESAWDPTGNPVRFEMHSGEEDVATVVKFDPDVDLALIQLTKGDAPLVHDIARLALRTIHDGEPIDVIGSLAGLDFSYSRVYVAHTREPEADEAAAGKEFRVLELTGPVFFGDSGGGCFTAEGELVGVMDYMRGDGDGNMVPGLSFAIHRDVLANFLK